MAATPQLPGATPVSVGSGTANALELLGYTVSGCEIHAEKLIEDIPGDQGGGEGGIPIEFQIFGEIHRIHLELSKWDAAILTKLEACINVIGTLTTITAGKSPIPGSFILANNAYFRLLLNPPNMSSLIRNYPIAIPREPHVVNAGTKWARLVMDWVAYPDLTTTPPLLWNGGVVVKSG
jgi:hypothetical protein